MKALSIIILALFLISKDGFAQNFPNNFVRMGEMPVLLNSSWQPKSIFFSSDQTGFVIGDGNPQNINDTSILIYRTTNSGQNWIKTFIPGIHLASEMRMTNTGMLYFTIRDTTSNPCVVATTCFKVCYSLDNGINWLVKKVDNTSGFSGNAQVYFLNDNDAILVYGNYSNDCGTQNGIYLTNNRFSSVSFISDLVPGIVNTSYSDYRFWNNQKLISISAQGILSETAKGINCPNNDMVNYYSSGTDDYYIYQVECPEQEGLDTSRYWLGIRRDNIANSTSTMAFVINRGGMERQVFGTSLISRGFSLSDLESFTEIDFLEDSMHYYAPIERTYFGDYNYLEDCSKSFFYSKNVGFVLGAISNEDDHWVLYKTTTGQPYFLYDSQLIYGNVSGINTNNSYLDKEFIVYPNPTNNRVVVRSEQSHLIGTLILIDSQGRLILTKKVEKLEQVEFDMSPLENGVYYVQYQNENSTIIKKIIKQ